MTLPESSTLKYEIGVLRCSRAFLMELIMCINAHSGGNE